MSRANDLFDLYEGRARRDAGMKRVIDGAPDFANEFLTVILRLPIGWTGQCEDIRRDWNGTMPSPQAWGACWGGAKRRGLLEELPVEVAMKSKKSHARKTHLFRRRRP